MKEKLSIALAIFLVVIASLGFNWIFTYGLIWATNNIFAVDYWSKFWYIFWVLYIMELMLGFTSR